MYGGNVLATPTSGQTTTTLAKATVADLDLSGHMVTTAVGPDGETHPNGVWLAWIKTHGPLRSSTSSTTSSRRTAGRRAGTRIPGPACLRRRRNGHELLERRPELRPAGLHRRPDFIDPGGDDEHCCATRTRPSSPRRSRCSSSRRAPPGASTSRLPTAVPPERPRLRGLMWSRSATGVVLLRTCSYCASSLELDFSPAALSETSVSSLTGPHGKRISVTLVPLVFGAGLQGLERRERVSLLQPDRARVDLAVGAHRESRARGGVALGLQRHCVGRGSVIRSARRGYRRYGCRTDGSA